MTHIQPIGAPPLDPQTVQRWFAIIEGALLWAPEGLMLASPDALGPPASAGFQHTRLQLIRGRSYLLLPGGFLVRENRIRFCVAFGKWALPTRGEPK